MSDTLRRLGRAVPGNRRVMVDDGLLAAAMAASAVVVTQIGGTSGRAPDALGWLLLLAAHIPMVWRRTAPIRSFLALTAFLVPYHALDYDHGALMAASMAALYTIASTGPVLRSALAGAGVVGLMLAVKFAQGLNEGTAALRVSGWIIAFLVLGICIRYHRQHVAAVLERAERAERSREEEVRRRVIEERLRIARDLHDLLAHSITLVGVRTSVTAHVLEQDPDRLDRAAVAKALEDIAEACRAARVELRATLQVLRSGPDDTRGPLPGLDALSDLVATARAAGATVRLDVAETQPPAAVGAAAYRIVQEALTNAVRHGGPNPAIRLTVREKAGSLHVSVTNRGTAPTLPSAHPPGFGLVGMREQARSVGGTLEAGPHRGDGFEVRAVLPFTTSPLSAASAEPTEPAPADARAAASARPSVTAAFGRPLRLDPSGGGAQ
ncbi:histidine kinase [Streptomyces sp. PSKA30]|uniref:sensor histidine kinase n=1 Tax=Streptomyces sp. PSKA30 TaxID=2874597 RepID=UPI001CD0A814|nr:histidine kinase [Streptomyces sp. PSKA30]MBZ9641630.1 histidine kinase [Streptomyces sp. PSKA30]